MEITRGKNNGQEYVTSFRLPPGAWIRGYYLVIEGERVNGLLTDKRAATWVYRQIVSRRRDPGIMYYTEEGKVALRVFPFAKGETRTTGFEVIHRSPASFEMDGREVRLEGRESLEGAQTHEMGNVVLVTAEEKARLDKVTRTPYYHFILDMSAASSRKTENFITRMKTVLDSDPLGLGPRAGHRFTLASHMTRQHDVESGWEERVREFRAVGGFNLDRALKQAMMRNHLSKEKRQPVFAVVSDALDKAVFPSAMNGFETVYPEGGPYFAVNLEGGLEAGLLERVPARTKLPYTAPGVLAWPEAENPRAYLPDNGMASVVLLGGPDELSEAGDAWQRGLALHGGWLDTKLRPKELGKKRHDIVKGSLKAHIMTPYTSFISLENEAQRRALLRKQQEILSSDNVRDLGEEQEMSEPPLWLLLLIMTLILALFMRRRKTRIKGNRMNRA
jgi:hypothetical protein